MYATCTCQACCEQSGPVSHAGIGAVQVEIFRIMWIHKTCAFEGWLAWILGSKVSDATDQLILCVSTHGESEYVYDVLIMHVLIEKRTF